MPYNGANVRQTIRDKRRWHTPEDPEAAGRGFRGWHSRGYLPHFDRPGLLQMVNYRLDDAMPSGRRHEWAALLKIEDSRRQRSKIEAYLDRGLGACELRLPQAAGIVEENWLHFDERDYRMLAWVIMPNHVHLIVEVWQKPLSEMIKDWKGYTARSINRLLSRQGKLWQEDYWDRYIRDDAHLHNAIRYIESNPVKAGLCGLPDDWPFSSARFRDEYQRLNPRRPPDAC